jgi:4-methyl-5(b-hydroxyethyl)-thiazole monophosphate biosynthesis
MKKVLVPLAEGFEEIEAVAVIDILRRSPGIEVVVAGVGKKTLKGSHGITIRADQGIESLAGEEYDLIVLPGGMPGTAHLAKSRAVARFLKDQASAGRLIAAICAAPTILEKYGLLRGVRATCHFSVRSSMKTIVYVDEPVVRDGNVITSQGAGTAIDFALALIEILKGKKESNRISEAIERIVFRLPNSVGSIAR